jgi:hypothetical protein
MLILLLAAQRKAKQQTQALRRTAMPQQKRPKQPHSRRPQGRLVERKKKAPILTVR